MSIFRHAIYAFCETNHDRFVVAIDACSVASCRIWNPFLICCYVIHAGAIHGSPGEGGGRRVRDSHMKRLGGDARRKFE